MESIANIIALGFVVVMVVAVVTMEYLDYLNEREFDKNHPIN